MKNRGVVVIDLMGEDGGMEERKRKESEGRDHECRCEVCHCDNSKVPHGYEGRAVRYEDSLILLPQAYAELWGRWNSAGHK